MTVKQNQQAKFIQGAITLTMLSVFMLFPNLLQAQVEARVDRNTIILGDTITLVLETKDTGQSTDIDTSLLNVNFHLLDVRAESKMSFVNGIKSATLRTLYVLEPKLTGKLTIPAFKLGEAMTSPISITVNPTPTVASGEPPTVFVEAKVHSHSVYVNSQVVLTLSLYYRYSLAEGSLSDPQIEHATRVKLGDTSMTVTRHGVSYRVLERVFAVFPERSGELIIPEISFLGRVNEPNSRRGSLFVPQRNRGRRVRANSEALTIMIKPRPAQYPAADWLPARQLMVNSQLKTATGGARAGEPITRVIETKAVGLMDTMFPEIIWPPIANARVYPDTPESVSRNSGQWVTGRKVHSFAIVPENAGELLLPEISIPWWDTLADELKYAVIPAEIVDVLPALGAALVVEPKDIPEPVQQPSAIEESTQPETSASGTPNSQKSVWQTLAITGFTLWLLTLLLWWWLKRRGPIRPAAASSPKPTQHEFLSEFKNACNNNQPLVAATALRQFATSKLNIADGLSGLENQCRKDGFDQFAGSIQVLSKQLYAQKQGEDAMAWQGKDFYSQFESWLKFKNKAHDVKAKSHTLPPFYPE